MNNKNDYSNQEMEAGRSRGLENTYARGQNHVAFVQIPMGTATELIIGGAPIEYGVASD